MKALTRKILDKLDADDAILSRAFVDRSRKIMGAIEYEKRELIKEFNQNTTPAFLYDYYISICQRPTWDLTDDAKVAKETGLSPRTVKETRLKLQRAQWIRLDTFKYRGVKYALWFIGKAIVEHRFNSKSTIADFERLGLIIPSDTGSAESL